MKRVLYFLCFLISVMVTNNVSSQSLFKKLKDKVVNKAVDNAVDKKIGTSPAGESGNSNSGSNGKPSNTGGGGLSNTTPPDVRTQMAEAETAHAA